MKVRYQFIWLLLVVITSIFILSTLLQRTITKETSALLNEKLKETEEKDAPKILDLNASYIKNYCIDYSIWDQMCDFISGKNNEKWAQEELVNQLGSYKIDYIWVLDSNANHFYAATTRDSLVAKDIDIPTQDLKKGLSEKNEKVFFLHHNNSIVEVFAGGITKTSDKQRTLPQKGYFLLGRIVDSVYLANLKSLSPEIAFSFVNTKNAFTQSNDPTSGHFQFSLPIKDFYNKPIGAFNVSRDFPVLSRYQKFLNNYLFVFWAVISIIGILFYLIANKIIIAPLAKFSQALKLNAAHMIAPYLIKKNEFGSLSKLMTDFFAQNKMYVKEIHDRKKSENNLQKALQDRDSAEIEKLKAEEFLEQQQLMLQFNAKHSNLSFDEVIKELLALGANSIICERIGVWMYNDDISTITAEYIFLRNLNDCIYGGVASEKEYPNYFWHLKNDPLIIANDALNDPKTAEFAEDYLIPEGISSMLDVPIRSGSKVIGVVCCEHVGPKREWTVREQLFISSLSDIIAINFEKEQRRKAEALLHKNHLRFEETQELAKIGSWEYNFITNEFVWSKEMYRIFEMEGVSTSELFANYGKKIHPDDLKHFEESLKKLFEDKQTCSFEARIICSNGDTKYIMAIAETVLSARQLKVIGMRGTVQDISKQKQAALAKSEFLSCMSHEIRTPINGVIGVANLLLEEEMTEKQQEYVKTLNFSAYHLSSIVSDILDFSKIESGFMTFEKVSFNLEKNCAHLLDLFANQAAEKNIQLKFTPSANKNYSLYGDYVRLNQVLSNLLSNAIKFTEKGIVELAYKIKAENNHKVTVEFNVKDNGIGISEQQQEHIFESFTQANESITRKYGGTGLGLTICKKLVELQGGKISLNSKEGIGSEFIVELTFDNHVYNDNALKSPSPSDKKQSKDLTGMSILVAEDNTVNAMVLTRFLNIWKVKNKIAKDGLEVLDMLEKEHFDMILMDIQMPNLDGTEATQRIRESQNLAWKNLPIVAFTADASLDTHKSLLKLGFDYCITKPFNPDALFSFLQKKHAAINESKNSLNILLNKE